MSDKGPESIADILARLFISRGWGSRQARQVMEQAWQAAAGDAVARVTELGVLRRGVLEVIVGSSVLLQELAHYRKGGLLEAMQEALGRARVSDLRFRLGAVGTKEKKTLSAE